MNFYILDKNNQPQNCSLNEWKRFWKDDQNLLRRVIGMDVIGDIGLITFFHKMFELTHEVHDPALFETIGSDRNTNETIYSASYRTWEDAVKGHHDAINWAVSECKDNHGVSPACR
jgi:hypothetical protein